MVPRGSAELRRNSGSALLCVAGSALACTQGSRLCALHYFLICKEMKHSIRQGLQERRICSETLVLWHCSQRPGSISAGSAPHRAGLFRALPTRPQHPSQAVVVASGEIHTLFPLSILDFFPMRLTKLYH